MKSEICRNQVFKWGQAFHHIITHHVARCISVPAAAAQNGLLPGTRIARLRPHPAGLAPLVPEQAIQKQTRRSRHAILREQWPNLDLIFRSDEALSSSVVPIEAPVIHDGVDGLSSTAS